MCSFDMKILPDCGVNVVVCVVELVWVCVGDVCEQAGGLCGVPLAVFLSCGALSACALGKCVYAYVCVWCEWKAWCLSGLLPV